MIRYFYSAVVRKRIGDVKVHIWGFLSLPDKELNMKDMEDKILEENDAIYLHHLYSFNPVEVEF